MASKPWFSVHRNQWLCKYKPSAAGDWVTVGLGKHPTPVSPDRPPKRPPINIIDRHREYEDLEYRALNGLAPAPPRAKSLENYLDDYVAGYATSHDAGSLVQLRRHVATLKAFCAAAGIATMQGVTKAVCRDYLERRAGSVKPTTLQTEKGYLSPIWTRAVDDDLVAANPWKSCRVPGKKVHPEPTFWSSEEIGRIVAAAPKLWQKDLILILANTGIRISAVLAMRWDWVHWGGADGKGVIRIPPGDDKGGVGYTCTIEQGARAVLERRHVTVKSDLVFPHWKHGTPIAYDTANAAIAAAVVRAGVPPGTPHDLRHSYGRLLERIGKPMSTIQRQLGHRSATMTIRYTTASEDEASKWVGEMQIGAPPATPTHDEPS